MTKLVSSGYLKSNTPRADNPLRPSKWQCCMHAGTKGRERVERKIKGGSGWMKKEGGKVRMSNGDTHSIKPTHPHTLPYYSITCTSTHQCTYTHNNTHAYTQVMQHNHQSMLEHKLPNLLEQCLVLLNNDWCWCISRAGRRREGVSG